MTRFLVSTVALISTLFFLTVYFGFNDSTLNNSAGRSLDNLLGQLGSFADFTIHLSGHTDNIGSNEYNDRLSAQRAIAVKNYLVAKNIDGSKIKVEAYGKRKPVAPNTSESNRALNRRVELTISGQKADAPILPSASITGQQRKDTVKTQKQNLVQAKSPEMEHHRKRLPRLVWCGWRSGFHWDTPGKKAKRNKQRTKLAE